MLSLPVALPVPLARITCPAGRVTLTTHPAPSCPPSSLHLSAMPCHTKPAAPCCIGAMFSARTDYSLDATMPPALCRRTCTACIKCSRQNRWCPCVHHGHRHGHGHGQSHGQRHRHLVALTLYSPPLAAFASGFFATQGSSCFRCHHA